MALADAYGDWRAAVDQRLNEIYCITMEDAGLDEQYLIEHWKSNEVASNFVAWFGNKYDLDKRPMPLQAIGR
jgi:hypothetical protein